jgi:hypothetical protein
MQHVATCLPERIPVASKPKVDTLVKTLHHASEKVEERCGSAMHGQAASPNGRAESMKLSREHFSASQPHRDL